MAKENKGKGRKGLRMTMSRVNVLTRRDIKTFIRSTQPCGWSGGAKGFRSPVLRLVGQSAVAMAVPIFAFLF
jgi:hypothetical protein